MTYRFDIQGLRAIAVMIVLLFHFQMPFFTGGFIGVDIFFVISGYLISGHITERAERGEFKLTEFFRNRIIRLFPALFITIAVTAIAGIFFLTPSLMEDLARSAVHAVLSLSNILFFFEAGYFDAAGHTKPLLHTWSLGVEEQFYLIWPFVLLFLLKFKKAYNFGLAAIIVGVFILSEIVLRVNPEAAFFLTPLRIWQFAVGALVCSLRLKYYEKGNSGLDIVLVISALAVIAACTVLYDETTQFPGLAAIPPTLAAGALLFARSGALSKIVLENPIAQYLGKISYSLYLVHWPLLVYYGMQKTRELTLTDIVILCIASGALAAVLYQLAEKRNKALRKAFRPASIFAFAAGATLLFTLPMAHLWKSSNFMSQWVAPEIAVLRETVAAQEDNRRVMITKTQVQMKESPRAGPVAAIFGDSLADDIFIAMATGYPSVNFKKFTGNGCRPLYNYNNSTWTDARRKRCKVFTEKAFKDIISDKNIKTVVIDSNWTDTSMAALQPTVNKLNEAGKRVIFVQPRVRFDNSAANAVINTKTIEDFRRISIEMSQEPRTDAYTEILESLEGSEIIRIKDIQCQARCENTIDGMSAPLIYDMVHFSVEGSQYIGRKIAQAYPNLFE